MRPCTQDRAKRKSDADGSEYCTTEFLLRSELSGLRRFAVSPLRRNSKMLLLRKIPQGKVIRQIYLFNDKRADQDNPDLPLIFFLKKFFRKMCDILRFRIVYHMKRFKTNEGSEA